MCAFYIGLHFFVSLLYLFFAEQASFYSYCSTTVVVYFRFIKRRTEGRAIEVYMRPVLLFVGIPQILLDMPDQFLPGLLLVLPFFRRNGGKAQIVADGYYKHRIVVDIYGFVRVGIELHAPFMLCLHIAPIGRSSAP